MNPLQFLGIIFMLLAFLFDSLHHPWIAIWLLVCAGAALIGELYLAARQRRQSTRPDIASEQPLEDAPETCRCLHGSDVRHIERNSRIAADEHHRRVREHAQAHQHSNDGL